MTNLNSLRGTNQQSLKVLASPVNPLLQFQQISYGCIRPPNSHFLRKMLHVEITLARERVDMSWAIITPLAQYAKTK